MRSFRYRIEWLLLTVLRAMTRVLPASLSPRTGSAVGSLIRVIWSKRRNIASENLFRAFPEWTESQVRETAAATFRNLGMTTFEILRITSRTRAQLSGQVEVRNFACLEKAASLGRGALLLSGHFGNWELFGGWVRSLGYPIDVVVKPMRNPLADEFYNARRADLDVGIIHTQSATRDILRSLRNQRFVAILADQYSGEEGVDVEFFGRTVSTPRGPAVLALRFGCPLLTGVFVRQPGGGFLADLDGPVIHTTTGDEEADVRAITQTFTSRLEHHIRRHPEQWLWTHRRWRG